MTRLEKIACSVCVAIGIAFSLLPRTWFELQCGVGPDDDSGLFEFLIAAVLIAVGLGLAIRFIRLFRSQSLRTPEKNSR